MLLFLGGYIEQAMGPLGNIALAIGFSFLIVLCWFSFKYSGYGKVKDMTNLVTVFVVINFFLKNSLLIFVIFNSLLIMYLFYVYLVHLVIKRYSGKKYRKYFFNRIVFLTLLLAVGVALRLILTGQDITSISL